MKELLQELFMTTYEQTIKDNERDYKSILMIIGKLCAYLISKNIITEKEVKDIFDTEKLYEEEK